LVELVLERGGNAKLSPDGHWLAYQSGESGTVQVYAVAFGGQVAGLGQQGSNAARWSQDGKELYYFDPTFSLFAVSVDASR
jgi:eukaryotic-like serine/threonine-protein kinase